MSRRPLSRCFAALLGLWFTVLMVEPVALHACPMHSGGHGAHEVSASAEAPLAHAEHHHDAIAHGEHGAPESLPPVADVPVPDDPTAGCLCLGTCAGATPTVLASTTELRVAELSAAPRRVPPMPAYAPVSRGGLVLPFANGPPTAL
jgi:hypothetical protein